MYLFVDQLTNVDFSLLDAKRGLIGETWLANFGLEGTLDEAGMVCDFGIVKSTLRKWLDDNLDHRLAIPVQSPNLVYSISDQTIDLTWTYPGGIIEMHAPLQAVAMVPVTELTRPACAEWVATQVANSLPADIHTIDLDFTPENISSSYYHYSHGLKKHDGNCQRIAHGHRSTIAIWVNDERSERLEQQWSERWRDIYLATREDLQSETDQYFEFAYQAAQGEFRLKLPKSQCYLIDTDTTVENIAAHIHQQIKAHLPTAHVKVKAFEGMGKGAIVSD